MEFTTLCTVVASLRVVPNRIQFFQYEEVRLSCEEQGNSSKWTVRRKALRKIPDEDPPWEQKGSDWVISTIYPGDSGLYWCESEAGQCSNAINITVTAFDVILEIPGIPLTEGDNLTLSCRNRNPSSNRTSDFYKDGVLVGSSSTGKLTIPSVTVSNEGLYTCNTSGSEPSPSSWLSVRGQPEASGHPINFSQKRRWEKLPSPSLLQLVIGEKINRSWVVYSQKGNSLHWSHCKFFSQKTFTLINDGDNDWKNCSEILKSHENSPEHSRYMTSWKELEMCIICIDKQ